MAAGTSPIFEAAVISPGQTIVNADSTNKKTLKAGGSNGSRIDEVYISNTDTISLVVDFYMNDGSTDFYLGNITATAGAGYTTVAKMSCMPTLSPNLGYIVIPNGYTLKIAAHAAITSGKQADIIAQGGDY